jgi:hypothetical protein
MGKLRRAKGRRNRDIRRIAASTDKNAADPRMIVTCIKRVPSSTEKRLEPSAKVHRSRIARYPDIPEIAGTIAGRNVHAAAQRDGEMREIPAHADPFLVAFRRRAIAPRVMVAELDPIVDIIADGLDPLATALNSAELRPGEIAQLLGIAVATAEQIDQRNRQAGDRSPTVLPPAPPRRACRCRRWQSDLRI